MRKSKRKFKNTSRKNDNEDTTIQSLRDMAKAVLRGKFVGIQPFSKRRKIANLQIDNLTHHLNELENEEQTKLKVNRRKEIIKIREEINKIEIEKTVEKNQ